MKHIQTFESFLNESKQAECVYMAPEGRGSLQKYNKKIATILSDDGDSITIKFSDGKTLTEVPKEQVRFLGESINTPVNEAMDARAKMNKEAQKDMIHDIELCRKNKSPFLRADFEAIIKKAYASKTMADLDHRW